MTNISKIAYLVILLSMFFTLQYVSNINEVAIINLLSLLLGSYAIIKAQKNPISPFLIIVISMYIFHSGQLWISLFKDDPIQFILSCEYSTSAYDIIRLYAKLTQLLIVFMFVGLVYTKPACKNAGDVVLNVSGLFRFLVICLYLVLMYYEVLRAGSVAAKGYGGGYHYSNNFASMLADWVNIMFITIIYAYKDNPKMFWRYTGLMLFKALFVMFFVGNRGDSVVNMLIFGFIVVRYSYLRKTPKKMYRLLSVMGIFLLIVLPLISILRSGGNAQESFANQGPIESFLMEFGDTARNFFLTDAFVTHMGHVYGMQMFTTSLTIIPCSTILFGDLINSYGIIGIILNEYFDVEGLGGSNLTQLYFNFGDGPLLYLSSFLMAYFCIFVSNMLMRKNHNIYTTLILLSLFAGLLINVRAEWYSVMSQLKIGLYMCLIIYISNQTGISFVNSKKQD